MENRPSLFIIIFYQDLNIDSKIVLLIIFYQLSFDKYLEK